MFVHHMSMSDGKSVFEMMSMKFGFIFLIPKTAKSEFSSRDTRVEKAPNFYRLTFLLNIFVKKRVCVCVYVR